ncbi:MAG TPA: 50S ribosomal protein L25 [Opitutaceae bacterium]|nr:50S ribosomal protein L25 [Opitutaceae bacterium]
MKTPLTLKVATRAQTGRSASRRLRKVNRIPAILYGKHSDPEKLSVEAPELTRLLKSVAGRALLIELNREDKPEKALSFLQEVQRDPITDRFLHIDLHEVKADEKFEIRVPVRVTGESFGVKNQSGVLEIATHALRVRCLPTDLPEAIEVDVTALNVGETIKVGEIKAIAGVMFLDDKGQPVVSCVEPVAEIVVEAPVAEAAVEGAPVVPAEGDAAAAAPPAGDAKAAPAGDAKAAPAGDKKAAPPAGDKKAAAPAPGAKPAPGARPAPPAKK